MSRRITLLTIVPILAGLAVSSAWAQARSQPVVARPPPLQILKSPTPEILARLFPATAARAGVEGGATVACVIRRDGTLGDCEVTGESPRGMGFGGAALLAMTYYQVSVDGPNAMQISRRLSGITIRFALPPSGTAATSAKGEGGR